MGAGGEPGRHASPKNNESFTMAELKPSGSKIRWVTWQFEILFKSYIDDCYLQAVPSLVNVDFQLRKAMIAIRT